ncbi:MAG TPA: FAD-binding protein, partial [Paracoccus sp. (in: a-proteobacteria)]|nr:FAD-binding protein [Paracoccus sp. (in: a-proteobacteria)]
MTGLTIAPADEAELAACLAERSAQAQSLRIAGGGTRVETDAVQAEARLTTAAIAGVVTYEPSEMVLIARAGTPLSEIEPMLAEAGQALAFEPPDMRRVLGHAGEPTVGGMVAANAAGPRRVHAGACRDHLLGVRFVDGQGRIIRNGGRVMKNVTGLDLGKLLCGAHGTLGVLTEVALKTLPAAPVQATLAFHGVDADGGLRIFIAALATPFEISGAAFHAGTAWLRVEGLPPQLDYRCERLRMLLRDREIETIPLDASRALWRGLRDLEHLTDGGPLWRILLKPTDAPPVCRAL